MTPLRLSTSNGAYCAAKFAVEGLMESLAPLATDGTRLMAADVS